MKNIWHSRWWRICWIVVLPLLLIAVTVSAQEQPVNGFTIAFGGQAYDGTSHQTTFTYIVSGTGTPPDLSFFVVEIPDCPLALEVTAFSPAEAVEIGVDPTTGIRGLKWDLPLGISESRTYTLAFSGYIAPGEVAVAVKGGDGFATALVPGASCNQPAIDLEKFVSPDGGTTWLDVDSAPGPDVPPGSQVTFRYLLTNTGNVPLQVVSLSDDVLDLSLCSLPASLDPAIAVECVVGPLAVVEGQHSNTASAQGRFQTEVVQDADQAHYFSGSRPSIDVEKLLSVDGGVTWQDADSPPGVDAQVGSSQVLFRFIVTNDGNVPLTNVVLSDDALTMAGCAIPTALQPAAIAECVAGPLAVEAGQHTDLATITADYQGTAVTDSDGGNYFGRTQPVVINGFLIVFVGRVYVNNQTTFTYTVSGTGVPPDLSHFDIALPRCAPTLEVIAYSPTEAVEFGIDPTTGINGIKWDQPLGMNDSRTYTLTFAGNVELGTVLVAVKGGSGFQALALPGPSCRVPSIEVQKFVSADGGVTWHDADRRPGLDVPLGTNVLFRFQVANDGNSLLTGLSLTDNGYDVSGCVLPALLEPDAFFECSIGPFPAEAGQHTNVATASGVFGDGTGFTTDSDEANYFGGDRPALVVEKYVSSNGGASWLDADGPPGPLAEVGSAVSFRFDVHNRGNVTLTGFTLTDSLYDTSACSLPAQLEPDSVFSCIIGPLAAEPGQHSNTITATALFGDTVLTATDPANYFGGEPEPEEDDEPEQPPIIVIEGPVTAININIITIYDINIELAVDDPLLQVIQIGDVLRCEGALAQGGTIIIMVAVNITFINVEVYVNTDGLVWRDPGDCGNAPPPWAPAEGWRRRCESGPGGGGSSGGGGGSRS